jgi:hypothetical protein
MPNFERDEKGVIKLKEAINDWGYNTRRNGKNFWGNS